ncbi:glycoside hydrolase family 16 protein [Flavobacterium sp. DGU11]|uniref:Glycoside hydrolase family 16 protein n=1 Tax=Flavobacterium arundinis TaxID=3139143 RepID=A0ABU9I1E6_9FLAO
MKKHFYKAVAFCAVVIAFAGCSSNDGGSGTPADPNQELINKLSGGSSRTWYWAAGETGHLAFGDNSTNNGINFYGNIDQAAPFEYVDNPQTGCLYDNTLTFNFQGGELKLTVNNSGSTLFNGGYVTSNGGTGTTDSCLPYAATGAKTVTFSDSDSYVAQSGVTGRTTGKALTIANGGFMGYFAGQSTYEILSLTNTRMTVRAIIGNDPSKAVYHTFTTTQPTPPASENFTNLVWSDEFNTPGAPDPAKWSYNTGAGGWGNNEQQYYTNSAENVVVADGKLVITAKKQTLNGSPYTSARLVSDGKYSFKYGRAVIRAKLPTGAGTWPAIWMLGQNYTTAAWPSCGEIDIMEHVGNQQNRIFGTLHYPGHFGGSANGNSAIIPNVSTDFHEYSVIWNTDVIKMYAGDVLIHSVTNDPSLPFDHNFFFILNIAMGGNFGGNIDPNFTQSSLEIDYIRVYQ